MKYKRSTPNRAPLTEIQNIRKPIRKLITKTADGHHHLQAVSKIPYTNFKLEGEGIVQYHKMFKEDETCFHAYKQYQITVPESACDNDCLTEPEQIAEARRMVISDIKDTLKYIKEDISQIKNYGEYESYRGNRAKRCRMI